MKATTSKEIHLTLSEEEARAVRAMMQYPVPHLPDDLKKICENLFNVLDEATATAKELGRSCNKASEEVARFDVSYVTSYLDKQARIDRC